MTAGLNRPFTPDVERSAIVIAYRNNEYIADEVAPYYTVGLDSFKYEKQTIAENYTLPSTRVGRRSDPNVVTFSSTTITDSVVADGLTDFVPQSDIDNATAGQDLVGEATLSLIDLILLAREITVANMATTAGNYSASAKKVMTDAERFGTATTGLDPADVILDAIDAMIIAPNSMVMGQALWNYLRKSDSITNAILGSSCKGKLVTREEFAKAFELDNLFVGKSRYNTAKKGQTASLGKCWGKDMVLFNRSQTPRNGTAFLTMRKGDRVVVTEEVKKKELTGGIEVTVGEFTKPVMISEPHAYLVKNCLA